MRIHFCCWQISGVARCPASVRQALQSGRWSTNLDLWIYAGDGALRGIRRDCFNPRRI
jgi:hypothetical protein